MTVLVNILKVAKRICRNFENAVLERIIVIQGHAFTDMRTTVAMLGSVGVDAWPFTCLWRVRTGRAASKPPLKDVRYKFHTTVGFRMNLKVT